MTDETISQDEAKLYKAFYEFMVGCDMDTELIDALSEDHATTPIDDWDAIESVSEFRELLVHIKHARHELGADIIAEYGLEPHTEDQLADDIASGDYEMLEDATLYEYYDDARPYCPACNGYGGIESDNAITTVCQVCAGAGQVDESDDNDAI